MAVGGTVGGQQLMVGGSSSFDARATSGQALADGRVAGAALDSLADEPKVSAALLEAQTAGANLLVTPHAAFYSDEVRRPARRPWLRTYSCTRHHALPYCCPRAVARVRQAFVEMRHLAAREIGRILRGEAPLYQVH